MKKTVLAAVAAALMCGSVYAQQLKTDDDKALYSLGFMVGRNLKSFSLKSNEYKMVEAGFRDAATGKKEKVDPAKYMPQLEKLNRERVQAASLIEKKKSDAYLAKMRQEKGAVELSSGIVYIPMTEGTGDSPKATDIVTVKYKGTLSDGSVFEDITSMPEPAKFPLDQVVPCWTEGIQKLKKGGKGKLVCPSDTAYGDMGMPPVIPGGAALTFEVELLDFSDMKSAMPAPEGDMVPPPAPAEEPAAKSEDK